jgi:hypothetical protein
VPNRRREQRVIAQVALAGDERKRPRRGDRRLDGRQAQGVHDQHAHGHDDGEPEQPAAQRVQRRQRPDVEGDVQPEGRVGLAEGHLRLEAEPRLPLAEGGQAESQADDQGNDRHGGGNGRHAARVAIFLGRHAPQTPGGPRQVEPGEDGGHRHRRQSEAHLGAQAQRKDRTEVLGAEPARVEPQAQPERDQQDCQHHQPKDHGR